MFSRIKENIERRGQHVYSIVGGESPRYLYTIGLREDFEGELVLAGMAHLATADAVATLNVMAERLREGSKVDTLRLDLGPVGPFKLREVDESWSRRLLLGVLDYYDCPTTRAWQAVPDNEEEQTIDIPDMSKPFEPASVWKWFEGGWPYSVASSTTVVTNKDALLGYAVSELTRWEGDEFEMFSGAGPDVPKEEMLVVPLATLLAFDSSLEAALALKPGEGLYREFDEDGQAGPWQAWRSRSEK